MSETYIPAALRRLVEERAQAKCEYCHLPSLLAFISHEIDHIIVGEVGHRIATFSSFGVANHTPIDYLWLVGDSTHLTIS
jgi:hypothetical protein